MLDYFNPKLLDEYDHIVFGPFWGDLYWEYVRWQSFIRWYTNLNPDKKYEIWTRNSRKGLYINISAKILRFDYCSGINQYESDGYKLKEYPEDMRKEIEQGIEKLYTEDVIILYPPHIDRDDFFNPRQMDLNLYLKCENHLYIQRLINTPENRMSVAICPPKESIMWKRIHKSLVNSDKHTIFLIEDSVLPIILKYLPHNSYNLNECKDVFGMSLCAMIHSDCICGDESNPYFKIAKELKFLKTYSISNKSSLDISKVLKCNV